ncbi:hypothetical protein J3R82DRAFT_9634 [Butyriboletus roseoflavus]|nr:hypothetical protein J3R82DRAFT_9634 [Butyriboletus roseoflavus]
MDTDVEQPQSVPPPTTSTLDMATSLRAAALLSRKRRRVDSDAPSLPPRLVPEPTLQLDYGYDDPTATQSDRKLTPVLQPTILEPSDPIEDIEDGQIREEGEISDTETSPPPPRSPTPPPRLRQRPFVSQLQESARVENPLPPCPPSRIEAPIASPLEPSDAQGWQPAGIEPFVLETSTYRLDADHVRPGLTMTQDQYNTAKEIVLDLLGWGVPPEYLLECGLSQHVIFYVFSELNLRLPSNLDTSGLIPYPTPEILALMPVSPSLSTRSLYSSSSIMPPPSVIPARVSLAERVSMERIDTRMSSPDPFPYIKAEPSSPSSVDLSNPHSLLVIEQQRRQELLARKAVIASRKVRQSEPPGFAAAPSKDQDIDMSAIPAQSVDEFLKTIEPTPHLDASDSDNHNRGLSVGTTSFSSSELMDVDDLVPGLFGASRDTSTCSAGPSSGTAISSELDSPTGLPTELADDEGTTSNGTERGSATSVDMAGSGSLTPILQGNLSYASLDGDNGYPQRRGMKRPVAADFVDFDSGPGPSRGHGGSSSNGYSNGVPYPNPLSKRKTGSFAGISGMRRCVIELSDSEDDGDNQVRGDHVGNGDIREYSPAAATAFTMRVPPRLTVTPTMSLSFGSMGTTNGNTGQPVPPAPATNALAEKEEEIKKMRRLIAQREESRLKKLAAMSGKSTSVMPPTAEVPAPEGMPMEDTPAGLLSRRNSSTSRDHSDRPGHSGMVDGDPDLFTSDNSGTAGTPSPTGNRNDFSVQETSTTIGSLSRFSASPTAG